MRTKDAGRGLGVPTEALREHRVCPLLPRQALATKLASVPFWLKAGAGSRSRLGGRGGKIRSKSEEVMIQNLEKNPTTICIDSGAGESVCPVDFFPDYETHETEKVGNLYRAAGGQELKNMGEKRPKLKIGGVPVSMTFQATSHVRKPLAAASKITAKGNRIVLDDEESLSYIENKATGKKIPLKIQNGVYVMEVQVTPKKAPF